MLRENITAELGVGAADLHRSIVRWRLRLLVVDRSIDTKTPKNPKGENNQFANFSFRHRSQERERERQP